MTDRAKALREALRNYQQTTTLVGKVVAIDEDNETVDVELLRNGVVMHDIRLKAIINGDGLGIIVIPEEESTVHVSIIEKNENNAYVSGFSSFKRMKVKKEDGVFLEIAEDGKIIMKGDEVHLNGDSKGALMVISSVVDKINRLEDKVNGFIDKFLAHIHTNSGGPTGTPQTSAQNPMTVAKIPENTTAADLENPKVKHGN